MSSIRETVSLAANESTGDILTREGIRLQLRTAEIDGVFTAAFTQSALGLEVDILNGANNVSSGTKPVVSSVAPKLPDDLSGTFAIAESQQVAIPVRNTTAGPITLNLILDIP